MLHRLEIRNGYRHPNTVIDFEQGYTAVVGPNESGKTIILEMICYALFGSVALRGGAADYKKLEVELTFSVAGEKYTVNRIGGKHTLQRISSQGLLVIGVKETNAKIVEILGYDYNVFRVCNYTMQGKTTALSDDMKPTERRRMVDTVIGMDVLDAIDLGIGQKIQVAKGVADGLGLLGEIPAKPAKPVDFDKANIDDLKKTIQVYKEKSTRKAQLEGWLSNPRSEPRAPENKVFDEDLDRKVERFQLLAKQIYSLEQQAKDIAIPPVFQEQIDEMELQWGLYNNWLSAKLVLDTVEPVSFTVEDLDAIEKQIEKYEHFRHEMKAWEGVQDVTCPECQHTFKPGQAKPENVPEPMVNRTHLANNRAKLALWNSQRDQYASAKRIVEVPIPAYTTKQLQGFRRQQEEYLAAQEAKKNLALLKPEYVQLLPAVKQAEARDQYHRDLAQFTQAKKEYDQWLTEKISKEKELTELAKVGPVLKLLEDRLHEYLLYQQTFNVYVSQLEAWKGKQEKLSDLALQVEHYDRARSALKELRSRIKKYLVPSLNKVASALVSQMTGGERNLVEVNEDFEITVDGQPVHTLSGSGKAVVNLAIRIGLGQVLINKKFSVFLGDEIDGDMDAMRAGYTSECLGRLTQHIGQLILISHRRPAAEHYIETPIGG